MHKTSLTWKVRSNPIEKRDYLGILGLFPEGQTQTKLNLSQSRPLSYTETHLHIHCLNSRCYLPQFCFMLSDYQPAKSQQEKWAPHPPTPTPTGVTQQEKVIAKTSI